MSLETSSNLSHVSTAMHVNFNAKIYCTTAEIFIEMAIFTCITLHVFKVECNIYYQIQMIDISITPRIAENENIIIKNW